LQGRADRGKKSLGALIFCSSSADVHPSVMWIKESGNVWHVKRGLAPMTTLTMMLGGTGVLLGGSRLITLFAFGGGDLFTGLEVCGSLLAVAALLGLAAWKLRQGGPASELNFSDGYVIIPGESSLALAELRGVIIDTELVITEHRTRYGRFQRREQMW